MIKRTIVEIVREYDETGKLTRLTETTTTEEDNESTSYIHLTIPTNGLMAVCGCDEEEVCDTAADADEPEAVDEGEVEVKEEVEIELDDDTLDYIVEKIVQHLRQ